MNDKVLNRFAKNAFHQKFEIASFNEDDQSPNIDFSGQIAELYRANALLDLKKNHISLDLLSSLTSKTACEKAAESYDTDFWLSIPLSWNSVLEIMKEVSFILKKFKTNIPTSWSKLSDIDLSSLSEAEGMDDDQIIINSVERRTANNV